MTNLAKIRQWIKGTFFVPQDSVGFIYRAHRLYLFVGFFPFAYLRSNDLKSMLNIVYVLGHYVWQYFLEK